MSATQFFKKKMFVWEKIKEIISVFFVMLADM